MNYDTRPVGWIKSAQRAFERFPSGVRDRVNTALTIAAEGGKADFSKPLKGLGRPGNRGAPQNRCLSGGLCHRGRRYVMGATRLPEKIPGRNQDAESGD